MESRQLIKYHIESTTNVYYEDFMKKMIMTKKVKLLPNQYRLEKDTEFMNRINAFISETNCNVINIETIISPLDQSLFRFGAVEVRQVIRVWYQINYELVPTTYSRSSESDM